MIADPLAHPPTEGKVLINDGWLAALATMKGGKLAVAAAILGRTVRDAIAGVHGGLVYDERSLADELEVTRHAVRAALADLHADGLIVAKRTDNRHRASRVGVVGAEWQPPARPLVMTILLSDEEDGSTTGKRDHRQPVSTSSTSVHDSANREHSGTYQPVPTPLIPPVHSTSQNQGSARSPKPNGDGRLPTTPLTRGVSSAPSASGSAHKVAPLQKALPLSSQSEATPNRGPSEAKDEAPKGPEEAGSPSGDPSPARVRLSRQPARAIKAADYLRTRILAQQPGHQLRTRRWNDDDPLRATWSDDVRKLVEIDHRSYDELAMVIAWLFDKQVAECRFVVHSPSALRAKWDRIVAVMSAPPRQAPAFTGPRGRRSDDEEAAAALAMAPRAPSSWTTSAGVPQPRPPRAPAEPPSE